MNRKSTAEWHRYLEEMAVGGALEVLVGKTARQIWNDLRSSLGDETPHAGPTDDGSLQMVWDKGEHHLEIEVTGAFRYEWFYRNRSDDRYSGEENCAAGDYSKLLSVIGHFGSRLANETQ